MERNFKGLNLFINEPNEGLLAEAIRRFNAKENMLFLSENWTILAVEHRQGNAGYSSIHLNIS